ncbi:MAG: hypothetical protein D6694_08605 [Gammaproteobacteria bacterium]|nr:MAG: hypothetical protein D6694_08605 [Gammaproteobacteria bacterium]
MEFDAFLQLSDEDISRLVAEKSADTALVFLDGSRRWFMLENRRKLDSGWAREYIAQSSRRHVEIFGMFFRHGIRSLVSPMVYTGLLERGAHYDEVKYSVGGLATFPEFLEFYESFGVRVRFYGDFRRKLCGTPLEPLCDLFTDLETRTRQNDRFRLFYGMQVSPPGESANDIARLSVEHYQETGAIPSRKDLIRRYYGEPVNPLAFGVTFEVSALEYPLLGGSENLYYSVRPTMYLDEYQLRSILYDHLFLRGRDPKDYRHVLEPDLEALRAFYDTHNHTTLGVGRLVGKLWVPDI